MSWRWRWPVLRVTVWCVMAKHNFHSPKKNSSRTWTYTEQYKQLQDELDGKNAASMEVPYPSAVAAAHVPLPAATETPEGLLDFRFRSFFKALGMLLLPPCDHTNFFSLWSLLMREKRRRQGILVVILFLTSHTLLRPNGAPRPAERACSGTAASYCLLRSYQGLVSCGRLT